MLTAGSVSFGFDKHTFAKAEFEKPKGVKMNSLFQMLTIERRKRSFRQK